jgi:hypothetical protein
MREIDGDGNVEIAMRVNHRTCGGVRRGGWMKKFWCRPSAVSQNAGEKLQS